MLGPFGILMTTCFLALALAAAAAAAGFARALPMSRAWAAFAIAAVGFVVVSVIPTDRGVTATTTSGLIHNVTGALSFLAIIISQLGCRGPCGTTRGSRASARGLSRVMLATAAFVLVFLAAGPLASVGVFGLAQRLFLACALLWIFLASPQLSAISMTAQTDRAARVRV